MVIGQKDLFHEEVFGNVKKRSFSGFSYRLGFGVGCAYTNYKNSQPKEVVESGDKGFDLKLPGEVVKATVTEDTVKSKLVEIGELTTYSEEFDHTKGKDFERYFLDYIPIPGSKAHVTITAKLVVKAGYDLDSIKIEVDDTKIYMGLPKVTITDHYVIWDSIECREDNNILNPNEFDRCSTLISELEEDALTKSSNDNLLEKAETHCKEIIQKQFSQFEGYEVVFM